ncbi:MAG: S24/S26 family peptidase [Bacteroidales bacterium]|nr:S24/S26 family peptidase [Bacteroidales bacterium]
MAESTIRTIPNKILIPDIAKLLEEGIEVKLQAKGRSMSPYIRDMKDLLVLQKVIRQDLEVEDIVLARCGKDHYVIHRIIEINGDEIVLMGDGNVYGTERCKREDVLGKLIAIERKGKRIDCNTAQERKKAYRLRTCYRTYAKTRHFVKRILTLQIFKNEN